MVGILIFQNAVFFSPNPRRTGRLSNEGTHCLRNTDDLIKLVSTQVRQTPNITFITETFVTLTWETRVEVKVLLVSHSVWLLLLGVCLWEWFRPLARSELYILSFSAGQSMHKYELSQCRRGTSEKMPWGKVICHDGLACD
jgi:hypothetical protein